MSVIAFAGAAGSVGEVPDPLRVSRPCRHARLLSSFRAVDAVLLALHGDERSPAAGAPARSERYGRYGSRAQHHEGPPVDPVELLLLGRYDNYSEIFDRTAAKRERIAPRVPAAPWISLDELSKELQG